MIFRQSLLRWNTTHKAAIDYNLFSVHLWCSGRDSSPNWLTDKSKLTNPRSKHWLQLWCQATIFRQNTVSFQDRMSFTQKTLTTSSMSTADNQTRQTLYSAPEGIPFTKRPSIRIAVITHDVQANSLHWHTTLKWVWRTNWSFTNKVSFRVLIVYLRLSYSLYYFPWLSLPYTIDSPSSRRLRPQ